MFDQFIKMSNNAAQLCNSYKSPNTSLMEQTTMNLQWYSDLVYITGGKLAHDKCRFYYVKFYFDPDGNVHLYSKIDLPASLLVVDAETNEVVSIK